MRSLALLVALTLCSCFAPMTPAEERYQQCVNARMDRLVLDLDGGVVGCP